MAIKPSANEIEPAPAGPRRSTPAEDGGAEIHQALLEARGEMAVLNRRVAGAAGLRDIDLDCLEVLHREGPLSPTALARRLDLRPATLTGVLDRLARDRWLTRAADPHDRRATIVRIRPAAAQRLRRRYRAAEAAETAVAAGFDHDERATITRYLTALATALRDVNTSER